MSLPYDIARCAGNSDLPCSTCRRREPGHTRYQAHIEPAAKDGRCEYEIRGGRGAASKTEEKMYCPKDGKACCDDLCHGAGCLEMDGYPMLYRCDVCGGTVDESIPDCGTCTCTCDLDEDAHWDYCPDCSQDWVLCKCSLDYPPAASHNAKAQATPAAVCGRSPGARG